MNPDTGELRDLATPEEMKKALSEGFEVLPDDCKRAAQHKLKGQKSAMVSLSSGGKLSRWAASKRKKKKQKEKAARRSNRRKGGKQ